MGKTFIDSEQNQIFDSYECDNCGEGVLVFSGVFPAGWQSRDTPSGIKEWRCPQCRIDK